jgi:hypothetical protein
MNQKQLSEALPRVADSDAADNKAKHDADTKAALLSDAFVTFIHQHDFKPGVSSEKRSAVRSGGNGFIILESRDYEPLFDGEARSRTVGFEIPLNMLVGAATAMTAWLSPFQ